MSAEVTIGLYFSLDIANESGDDLRVFGAMYHQDSGLVEFL